jgi:hypothetical protein
MAEQFKHTVSLKKYMRGHQKETELRWKAHRREHELMEKALGKAEEAMGTRLAAMNEFRAALENRENAFATKETLQVASDRVDDLEKFRDRFIGVIFGITALNAFVSYLIIRLFGLK